MKVLHLIDSGGFYGAESVLYDLINEQQRAGVEIELLSIGLPGCPDKMIEKKIREIGVHVTNFRMKKGLNIIGILQIIKYAKLHNFDLLHSHGYKTNILLGLIPARFRKLKIVTTLHGWINIKRISSMRLYEWLESRLLDKFDAIIVVNRNMLSHHNIRRSRVKSDVIYIINNAVNFVDDNKCMKDPDLLNIAKDNFSLVAIGRLSPEKGYDVLIKALAILRADINDINLTFIGDGPQRKELEKLTAFLNLRDNVTFAGYRESARQYLEYFKIFILSSYTEGLPITLLEAMHAGVPVIATSVGGIPDVIESGQNGLLVSAGSPEGIAAAVRMLYEDEQCRETIINNARKTIDNNYSCSRMAALYDKVYMDTFNCR